MLEDETSLSMASSSFPFAEVKSISLMEGIGYSYGKMV